MIDKKQTKAKGVKVIVRDETFADRTAATIAQLKQLLPNVINSDNQLDALALADVLDIANTTSNNQGYELTFAGKGIARTKADSPTNFELKTELAQSKNFDETDNVVIRGDNIDVLKILYQNYHNKIKMIYIDPPYNTENENFVYDDNFKKSKEELIERFGLSEDTCDFLHNVYGTRSHSGWLSFMYPRLKLARDLLTDNGAIFISIDDNEQANLKIICDEIFGEDNFIYHLSVVNSLNGNDNSSGMMETHESCLIYAKNTKEFKLGVLPIQEQEELDKWEKDELGFWKEGGSLKATGVNAPREARPNLFYPIYIDEQSLDFSLERTDKYSIALLPMTDGKEMSWYWGKEKFIRDKNEVLIKKTGNGFSLYKKQRPALGDLPSRRGKTTFYSSQYSTSNSNASMKKLFGASFFTYTKAVTLMKDFISLGLLSNDKNDIILDFFAGSGTTGDAVMQLNAGDGGNRKFVLVQWDEIIDKNKSAEAHKFCTDNNFEPVISSITIERLNRAGEKIKEEYIAKNGEILLTPPPPPPPPPPSRYWL